MIRRAGKIGLFKIKKPGSRKNRALKRLFPFKKRSAQEKKKKKIIVFDENGNVVFKGYGRRRFKEQVFFDSASSKRRFALPSRKISEKRLAELAKAGTVKTILGRTTFVDKRNPKHRKEHI